MRPLILALISMCLLVVGAYPFDAEAGYKTKTCQGTYQQCHKSPKSPKKTCKGPKCRKG